MAWGEAQQNKQTLADVLTASARAASDGRLVLNAVAGIMAIAAAILWRLPGALFVLSFGACFAAYGVWGIAQRELDERAAGAGTFARVVLLGVRAVAAVVAAVVAAAAVGVVLFALLATALGTWIS